MSQRDNGPLTSGKKYRRLLGYLIVFLYCGWFSLIGSPGIFGSGHWGYLSVRTGLARNSDLGIVANSSSSRPRTTKRTCETASIVICFASW